MTIKPGMRMPDYDAKGPAKKKSARALDERPGYMGDMLAADVGNLKATIMVLLAARGAIFFGMPRTGQAVLIRAWVGGDVYEDYCATEGEVQATLEALRDAGEAAMVR